ncbi:hypothetical protein II5_04090 [Bacillus cereus MSX-A1]|nr:hypothetical protein II5_04090 [Bacillus cereus MSX-A1]
MDSSEKLFIKILKNEEFKNLIMEDMRTSYYACSVRGKGLFFILDRFTE